MLRATLLREMVPNDVKPDATAVLLSGPADRGLANGIQLAGGYVGFIVGGAGAVTRTVARRTVLLAFGVIASAGIAVLSLLLRVGTPVAVVVRAATTITGSLCLAIGGLVATAALLHARPLSPPPAAAPDLARLS